MSIEPQLLSELKEKLLQEKRRVEDELARITKPTQDDAFSTTFNEIGEHEDENASEVEEYTDNLALESSLEKQLKDITGALDKIDSGSYGKCENCGADIPIERLKAYPAAKKCMEC